MRDLAGKKDESFVVKLYESTRDFNPQIQRAMDEHKPDLFILDHFIVPPALPKSGIPWLYLFSGSPTAILDSPDLPPFTSGYSVNGDRTDWDEFRSYRKAFRDLYIKYQTLLYQEFDYEPTEEDFPLPRGSYPQCKYGYIYGYPEELDYHDVIRIPENYIRVDGFCRESTEPFQLPEGFRKESEKLIFFSLGSMGGVDVELMKRVTSILSKTPHKTIVSKGPLADEYELPENCWGKGSLPQMAILPMVDLVITHGGNNTVTETFSFGKPTIVLPMMGDQYDNAQRIQDKGFGRRLETYKFKEEELLDAVEKLINDEALKEKLQAAAKRIATSNSKVKACERIEALAEKYA
ncbi:PREDICTED: uncharacterized UDP-glucosyltransferase YojK-like, partial [Rhagoletis zephyria]|uniref:uncharacterized UDP-glucosyltransferase YojK-like n=1 Tax=Rhagoletis zephyria TaxID=28612 RepID=UPI00081168A7